jgi:hypothetical protein
MKSDKRTLMLAGIAMLALSVLFGCSQPFWKSFDPDAGYIKLNVGYPGAKGINVDYHNVTGLSIAVYDPEDQELETFEWDAEEGAQSYLVQVNDSGMYSIEVTHTSDDNGAVVNVTEVESFEIEAMVITVINITPGVIGMIQVEGEDGGGEPPADGTLTVHLTDVHHPDGFLMPDGTMVPIGVYEHGVDPGEDPMEALLAVGGNELTDGATESTMTYESTEDLWIGTGGELYDVYIWFDVDGDLDETLFPELGTDWVLGEFPVTVMINGETHIYIDDPELVEPPSFE